jgi:hypothetical protein
MHSVEYKHCDQVNFNLQLSVCYYNDCVLGYVILFDRILETYLQISYEYILSVYKTSNMTAVRDFCN